MPLSYLTRKYFGSTQEKEQIRANEAAKAAEAQQEMRGTRLTATEELDIESSLSDAQKSRRKTTRFEEEPSSPA